MPDDSPRSGREIARRLITAVERETAGDSPSVPGTEFAGELGDEDAEPPAGGAHAGEIHRHSRPIAEVYVHSDRVRVEFHAGPDVAAAAADRADLRVRPKAVRPPRTLVFLESVEDVDAVPEVFRAVSESEH